MLGGDEMIRIYFIHEGASEGIKEKYDQFEMTYNADKFECGLKNRGFITRREVPME